MKILKGVVISNKMKDTVVVKVERMVSHPKYKKLMKRDSKFKAHTEKALNIGDVVNIAPCKKISKEKYFKVIEK